MMSLDGSQPQPQYAITQSMGELLTEVFQGRFENFRTCLKEREIVHLELRFKIPNNADLALLSQALQDTNVTSIDLACNNLGNKGAIGFAQNLKNTNVTTVELSWNLIGSEGAIGFAQNLRDTNVTTVDMSENQIGAEGASRFMQNLRSSNVTTIDLDWNHIGAKGAIHLAQNLKDTCVTTVNLSGNHIGAKGKWALKRALEIQRYLAPYAVMQSACNTADKEKITLNQPCPKPQDDAGPYARDIIKKLPSELAAMVAQRLILKRKNERNPYPLNNVARYELRPKHNSIFSPLMSFLIQENNHKRTQDEEPQKTNRLS